MQGRFYGGHLHKQLKRFGKLLGGFSILLKSARKMVFYFLSKDDFHKEVTELYPDPISSKSAEDLPNRTRGILENDVDKCTGCGECVEVCPTECFQLETELGPERGKVWISTFNIDHGKCLYCGLCVDVCAPASLKHLKLFESAVFQKEMLNVSFGKGSVTSEQRARWQEIRELVDREGGQDV